MSTTTPTTVEESETQARSAQKAADRNCFFLLFLVAAGLIWLFVWQQRDLIARPGLFTALIAGLLLISFWTSATEAGYSVVANHPEPKALTDAIDAEAKKLTEAAAEDNAKIHPEAVNNKPLIRLVQRRRSLKSVYRDRYVGAFASASVFANTALVAFMPAAVSNAATETHLTQLWTALGVPVVADFVGGPKVLTFVASTFLLLIVGKILPKMIGFRFPHFFTYKLGWAADIVQLLFGWIARGTRFPLELVWKS